MEGGEFREYWSNDDAVGGEGTLSRVVAVLPEPGDYVIRVNTFKPRQRRTPYAARGPAAGPATRTGPPP